MVSPYMYAAAFFIGVVSAFFTEFRMRRREKRTPHTIDVKETNTDKSRTNDDKEKTNTDEPHTNDDKKKTNKDEPHTNDDKEKTNKDEPHTNDDKEKTNTDEPHTNDDKETNTEKPHKMKCILCNEDIIDQKYAKFLCNHVRHPGCLPEKCPCTSDE